MFLIMSLVTMLAAAPSADAVGLGRKAFSQCLSAQIKPGLDKQLPVGEFQSQMKKTCADKEATFRAAILAADKADGMSEKAAQADADDQVAEYVDKITAEYEDYSRPS
ncbi:hypothetical protein J2W40_002338 [Sphingobium xenophagum]|uniref:Uncharacterized protein n=1 Tax=Sphingobium xenophagum TaxID=121428 RepID=A0ABU1X2Y3_SPHXE|nr:hypothetical protein [Sphingobium xenophagum]MDR7155506.1 hypothetical protein [Sphingobium xenophagum]